MKIESTSPVYRDCTVNIDNVEVKFVENVAEVADELGHFMIQGFDCFFEEGKVVKKTVEPEMHVFDETMIEEQANQIVNLHRNIDVYKRKIEELKQELELWKNNYDILENRFTELKKGNAELPIRPEKEEVKYQTEEDWIETTMTKEDTRKELENKNLEELKELASELKVPEENVQKKTRKKDWIDAIIDFSFKL